MTYKGFANTNPPILNVPKKPTYFLKFICQQVELSKSGRLAQPGQVRWAKLQNRAGSGQPVFLWATYILAQPSLKHTRAGRARLDPLFLQRKRSQSAIEEGKIWAQSRAILVWYFLGLYLLSPTRAKRRANWAGPYSWANFDSSISKLEHLQQCCLTHSLKLSNVA